MKILALLSWKILSRQLSASTAAFMNAFWKENPVRKAGIYLSPKHSIEAHYISPAPNLTSIGSTYSDECPRRKHTHGIGSATSPPLSLGKTTPCGVQEAQ